MKAKYFGAAGIAVAFLMLGLLNGPALAQKWVTAAPIPQGAEEVYGIAAGGKLYVADTNAHRIRVVELATKQVSTLPLQGVDPVAKN